MSHQSLPLLALMTQHGTVEYLGTLPNTVARALLVPGKRRACANLIEHLCKSITKFAFVNNDEVFEVGGFGDFFEEVLKETSDDMRWGWKKTQDKLVRKLAFLSDLAETLRDKREVTKGDITRAIDFCSSLHFQAAKLRGIL